MLAALSHQAARLVTPFSPPNSLLLPSLTLDGDARAGRQDEAAHQCVLVLEAPGQQLLALRLLGHQGRAQDRSGAVGGSGGLALAQLTDLVANLGRADRAGRTGREGQGGISEPEDRRGGSSGQ